ELLYPTIMYNILGSKTFEGRVLYVLDEINQRVTPRDFYKYGAEEETQQRIRASYKALQELKERFESFCMQRS
ncbi:hypothetical protein HYU07_05245, partial [Candidatus Woesearchaeota archaeon]|nr:hypothetical protein [Candidatus Woesearchaeota archaeon]